MTSKIVERKLAASSNKNVYFIFLTRTADPGCTRNVNGGTLWLERNVGNFLAFAKIEDLLEVNSNFSVVRKSEDLYE